MSLVGKSSKSWATYGPPLNDVRKETPGGLRPGLVGLELATRMIAQAETEDPVACAWFGRLPHLDQPGIWEGQAQAD